MIYLSNKSKDEMEYFKRFVNNILNQNFIFDYGHGILNIFYVGQNGTYPDMQS